jgi:molybdopterin-synthase adenylyltransferase
MKTFSAAFTEQTNSDLLNHLLQHYQQSFHQEDLCFALWRQSTGRTRTTAILYEVILPEQGERVLHGNASFESQYFDRALTRALEEGAGLAFLHSHPVPGWQGMSPDDVAAEQKMAPRVYGTTGLPLVGLTCGTDGSWSARFWNRVDRGLYQRDWASTVRVVGERLSITYADHLMPPPVPRPELLRTYSAWGAKKQADLARTRVGVVGMGSVGGVTGEALARQGHQHVLAIDFDIVKRHNLDRLVYATAEDIGEKKVAIASREFRRHATAANANIEPVPYSVAEEEGFRAALDCDALVACVDRPLGRHILNQIAYAHLIPVVDGGIAVRVGAKGMRGAEWRAHVAGPGRRCLQCLKQYDPADVSLERAGMLDDPTYIKGLDERHFIHRNENVFTFALQAAGLQLTQLLLLTVSPGGAADVGALTFHLPSCAVSRDISDGCDSECLHPSFLAFGDHAPIEIAENEAGNVSEGGK